jgi:hypothetical protein
MKASRRIGKRGAVGWGGGPSGLHPGVRQSHPPWDRQESQDSTARNEIQVIHNFTSITLKKSSFTFM